MPAIAQSVILLSFFDGIGTAALATQQLGYERKAFWSWETDSDCQNTISHHFPDVVHFGDFLKCNPATVADQIRAVMKLLPAAQLLITAGAPCPDYSVILGDSAAGMQGSTGKLFHQWCLWLLDFEA